MTRNTLLLLLIVYLLPWPSPALAELGAEDVRLPGQLASGFLFITTSGDLVNCRNVNGMIEFNRSTDNGKTWSYWSTLGDDNDPDTSWILSDVLHVDATDERVFISFRYIDSSGGSIISDMVVVAKTDPNGSAPFWTTSVIASANTSTFIPPFSIASDAENFAEYNLYLTYARVDADGNDIWFTRSTNKGSSFEPPYKVAGTTTSDRHFKYPDIDYGYAGMVHLVWISEYIEGTESSVKYQYASGRASSGLNWVASQYLTSNTDGLFDSRVSVAGSRTDGSVVVCYDRTFPPGPGEIFSSLQTEILCSTNFGGSFNLKTDYPDYHYPSLTQGPSGFVIGINNHANDRGGLLRPSSGNLGDPWQYEDMLAKNSSYGVHLAYNPAKENRWAMVGAFRKPGSSPISTSYPWFDAEWFQDPGYPVLVGGLPYGTSDVCLADIDANGAEDIVYTNNSDNLLYAYDGQLQPLPGFPVSLELTGYSTGYSFESIACGDVDGDGDLEIFVGSIGMIHGYDHLGQTLPGWPIDKGTGNLYRISLGTVSRSAPLDIVAAASNSTHLFRIDGSERSGSPIVHDGLTLGGHKYPVAFGDVENDGDMEMVVTLTRAIMILGPTGSLERILWSNPGDNSVKPARLVDMDLDGDLEVAFSIGSTLYLMHHDGTTFGPTWPWTEPEGRMLTPLALANNLGTSEPEMFFATSHGSGNEKAYSMTHSGTIPAGWPNELGTGFMAGVPLVDHFVGFPSGIVFLPTGGQGFGLKNFFGGMEGWPHPMDVYNWDSGASGDIDGDGQVELVVASSMMVYDTHGSATSQGRNRWPQSRFDSEGSSCANCIVDRVSAAPDEPRRPTRIAFAGGFPNPFSGQTSLQYELPARGAVLLEIYDIRGRRVREILRTEQDAGPHAMIWDRSDQNGQPVAGGTYLARLTARGPGLNEVLTRKITVIR